MKYFTFEWWSGLQSAQAQSDPSAAYREHLAKVRDQLTPDLLRLEGEVSIHDGRVHDLSVDLSAQQLALTLDGDDGKGGACRFELTYSGVREFKSTTNDGESLPGPGDYGDLGYWEVHVVPDGYEHRMLFSSGIEFRIVFADMTLDTTCTPTTDGDPTPDDDSTPPPDFNIWDEPDPVVVIDASRISNEESFHDEFARMFGFPDFYGRNMNAWVDCLTSLDEEDGMRSITIYQGQVLTLQIDHYKDFKTRCPDLADALVECAAFVNWRRIEQGEASVITLAFDT